MLTCQQAELIHRISYCTQTESFMGVPQNMLASYLGGNRHLDFLFCTFQLNEQKQFGSLSINE